MTDELTVDARGTWCRLPIHLLSRAIDGTSAGTIILLADDPNARVDVTIWCRLEHHHLLDVSEDDGAWRFVVSVDYESGT